MAYYKALIVSTALLMGCPARETSTVNMQEYYQKEKDRKALDRLQNDLRQDEIHRKGYSNIPEKPR